jgi:hypothetical protein
MRREGRGPISLCRMAHGNQPAQVFVNVVRMLVPPIVLIVAVLGSILGGLATPTEAAAVGAIGAILLAGFRLSEGRSSRFLGLCVAALIAVIALSTVTTLRPQRAAAGAVELGLAGLAVILCALAAAGRRRRRMAVEGLPRRGALYRAADHRACAGVEPAGDRHDPAAGAVQLGLRDVQQKRGRSGLRNGPSLGGNRPERACETGASARRLTRPILHCTQGDARECCNATGA